MSNADLAQHVAPSQERSSDAPLQSQRRIGRPVLFGLLAALVGVVGWDVYHTAPVQEWRFSRMSLESLVRERDAQNSHNPLLLYAIGNRLNEQGRFSEADGYLREAVGGEPHSARYRDAWARALLGSGLTTAAFGELSQFVGTHPHSAEAHLILGKFYVTQNSLNRAVEELTTATRLDSRLGEAWSYLAVAHQGRNEPGPAREAVEKAVALRPRNAGDRLLLAVLSGNAADNTVARASFEEAIRLSPTLAVAHREYANFLLRGGPDDAQRAITEARRAVALDAKDATASLILGRALAMGETAEAEEAVRYLERAAQESPADPVPTLAVAQTLRRLGRTAEADQWMRVQATRQARVAEKEKLTATLELNAQDAGAHRRLAHLLAEEGNVEGCVRHHAAAVRRPPDSPVALAEASDDLVSVGRVKDALPLARRAYEVTQTNPAAVEAMGNVLLALGKPDEAAKEYHKVLEWYPDRYPRFRAKMDAFYSAQEQNSPEAQSERARQNKKTPNTGKQKGTL